MLIDSCYLNYISIIVTLLALAVTIAITYSVVLNTIIVRRIAKETAKKATNDIKKDLLRSNVQHSVFIINAYIKLNEKKPAIELYKITIKDAETLDEEKPLNKLINLKEQIDKMPNN